MANIALHGFQLFSNTQTHLGRYLLSTWQIWMYSYLPYPCWYITIYLFIWMYQPSLWSLWIIYVLSYNIYNLLKFQHCIYIMINILSHSNRIHQLSLRFMWIFHLQETSSSYASNDALCGCLYPSRHVFSCLARLATACYNLVHHVVHHVVACWNLSHRHHHLPQSPVAW